MRGIGIVVPRKPSLSSVWQLSVRITILLSWILSLLCVLWPVPSGALSIERRLVEHATPLAVSATKSAAALQLANEGVCRINNVVSKSDCFKLRNHVLQMSQRQASSGFDDRRTIPGTRLRFAEPIAVPLNHRTDLLLPIEDSLVNHVLQNLALELGAILEAGAEILPGLKMRNKEGSIALDLVEAACLISETGATHQSLHADFRRDDLSAKIRLPARLVTFLYLQDAPTVSHGPTIFVPKTNSEAFHAAYYADSQHERLDASTARCATLNAGDVAIYDASVLHFGSANSAPNNTRVVLYFGVGLKNGQECDDDYGDQSSPVLQNLRPISLGTTLTGVRRFLHESIEGMALL